MYESCELILSKECIHVHKHVICVQFQEVHDPLEASFEGLLLVGTYSVKKEKEKKKLQKQCTPTQSRIDIYNYQ